MHVSRRSGVVMLAEAGHGATGARLLLERRRQRNPLTREVESQLIHSDWDEGKEKREMREMQHIRPNLDSALKLQRNYLLKATFRWCIQRKDLADTLPAVFIEPIYPLDRALCRLSCTQEGLWNHICFIFFFINLVLDEIQKPIYD